MIIMHRLKYSLDTVPYSQKIHYFMVNQIMIMLAGGLVLMVDQLCGLLFSKNDHFLPDTNKEILTNLSILFSLKILETGVELFKHIVQQSCGDDKSFFPHSKNQVLKKFEPTKDDFSFT